MENQFTQEELAAIKDALTSGNSLNQSELDGIINKINSNISQLDGQEQETVQDSVSPVNLKQFSSKEEAAIESAFKHSKEFWQHYLSDARGDAEMDSAIDAMADISSAESNIKNNIPLTQWSDHALYVLESYAVDDIKDSEIAATIKDKIAAAENGENKFSNEPFIQKEPEEPKLPPLPYKLNKKEADYLLKALKKNLSNCEHSLYVEDQEGYRDAVRTLSCAVKDLESHNHFTEEGLKEAIYSAKYCGDDKKLGQLIAKKLQGRTIEKEEV